MRTLVQSSLSLRDASCGASAAWVCSRSQGTDHVGHRRELHVSRPFYCPFAWPRQRHATQEMGEWPVHPENVGQMGAHSVR
jgi:hypothetical protein